MAPTRADRSTSETERIPCIIEVDLDVSRRGLTSVIAEQIDGRTVLDRVLDRVFAARSVDPPVLLVRREQVERARSKFPDSRIHWHVHDHPDIAGRDRLRRARLWGKEGWRGGIGDSYFFCEAGNPRAMREVCEANQWDAVIVVPAEAAFVDPEQLDAIAEYYLAERRGAPVYLSTAPPGLAGDIVSFPMLEATSAAGAAVNRVYGFRLDDLGADADQHRIYHHFDEDVTTARGRFTVDSRDALARARQWMSEGEPVDARELVRRARQPAVAAGDRPEELIVELTDDVDGAWPARPGRDSSPPLPIEDTVWERVIESVAAGDESLLTLGGGYADPLADLTLERRITELREAGAHGIQVDTTGVRIDEARARSLLAASPDAITVDLTVTRGDLLPRIREGVPPFEARVEGLEQLIVARQERGDEGTFILVSTVLDERTAPYLDEFVDRWWASVDRVLIRGIEGPEGRAVASSLGCFSPPTRFACARLCAQMRIERDGTVPICSRDPSVRTRAGVLTDQSVSEVWCGEIFAEARRRHHERDWDGYHHCGSCRSWFRFD